VKDYWDAKPFPPGPNGVLLPRDNRVCASRGLTLYTASKPLPLAIQWSTWFLIRTLGPRWLPGRAESIRIPYLRQISASLGMPEDALSSVALYRRRDSVRSGETFLAIGPNVQPIVIKVRSEHDRLAQEQLILAKLSAISPSSFNVPKALGSGLLSDGRTWSAQEMVFTAPHFPCTRITPQLLEDLSEALYIALPSAPRDHLDWRPAHNDLTPWNLRRDHHGRRWLFDWEDAGYAPAGADHLYFHAALGLVRPRRPMPKSNIAAAHFWIDRVRNRLAAGHPGENNIILNRLLTTDYL
jgi:hypothetical protein